jgi:hypothetical protein
VVLLLQGREEVAFLPAVTAVLLHHIAMDIWTDCSVLLQCREEVSFLPAVSAVVLHHFAMDIWTDWCVVITG